MEASRQRRLQECLSSLAKGDREAFTPVFDILWPIYRRFARQHLIDADADDAAQEALLKLFVRADEFDTSRDAAAFAIGVAYHEIRSFRRKRWRRREESVAPPESVHVSDGEDMVAAREADELIAWGLSRLSVKDRETLTLFAKDERDLSLPAATFRKRVQRALERVRAILKLR